MPHHCQTRGRVVSVELTTPQSSPGLKLETADEEGSSRSSARTVRTSTPHSSSSPRRPLYFLVIMRGRDGFDLCMSELAGRATPRFACVDGERQLAVEEEKELQREGCTTLATTIDEVDESCFSSVG
ncbi:Os09g0341801 [Oryza sativa Japonica Group]|nr:Os09g0341801 [Oryza sativa Japonica Group]